jgi:hypothetical protein
MLAGRFWMMSLVASFSSVFSMIARFSARQGQPMIKERKRDLESGHTCKDFSGGQKSIAQILAGIPNGPMADIKLTSPVIRSQGNGAPLSGNSSPARNTNPVSGNGNQGSGGGGGSSYQQLVGLYQSLVSTLTAYVSALSSSSGNTH